MELDFSGEYLVPGRSPAHLEAEHLERYRFARAMVPDRRVLDLACGTGYGSRLLAEAGARRVQGIDLSADVVAYARERHQAPNLAFATGDICSWRADQPFDVITCFETIEHVPDHLAALRNLRALLAPGGRLLISTPNRPLTSPAARGLGDRPSNPYHVREFTLAEILDALGRCGFTVAADGRFGQRAQLHLPWTLLRKTYRTLCKPEYRTDPAVRPLGRLQPQYYVLVATGG